MLVRYQPNDTLALAHARAVRAIRLQRNVDLYVDNMFDEVAIGHVLSSPFGFDFTLSAR